jgi:hypothetical protein
VAATAQEACAPAGELQHAERRVVRQ